MVWNIDYDGFVISPVSANQAFPTGTLDIEETFDAATISQSLLLVGADPDAYAILEAAMFAAYVNDKALVIGDGTNVFKEYDPAKGQAGAVRVTLTRNFTDDDSPSQKGWNIQWFLSLPATERDFRSSANISISFSGSRRRAVSLVGQYTFSDDANVRRSAQDTYQIEFALWSALVLDALVGTFHKVTEDTIESDDGSQLMFTALYQEQIYTTAILGILNDTLTINRARAVKVSPTRVAIVAQYTADLDINETLDVAAVWDAIFPALVAKITAVFGADVFAPTGDQDSPSVTGNLISGQISGFVAASGWNRVTELAISITYTGSRRRTATLLGSVIGDRGAQDAEANYDDARAAILAFLPTPATWHLLIEDTSKDDDDQNLTFSLQNSEVLFTAGGAGGTVNETFSFQTTATYQHGDGKVAAILGTVIYSTQVDHTVTDQNGLRGLYAGQIRPTLIAKLAAIYGGRPVVTDENVDISPNGSIATTMRFLMVGLSDVVLSFSETISYSVNFNNMRERKADGKHSSYFRFSPGLDLQATVEVRTRKVNGSLIPRQNITAPRPPSAAIPGGTWVHDRDTIRLKQSTWGKSPFGGRTVLIVDTVATRTYTWEGPGSKVVKGKNVGEVKVPSSRPGVSVSV